MQSNYSLFSIGMLNKFKLLLFIPVLFFGYILLEPQNNVSADDDLVWGCTDPFAQNWNPQATQDDGSCTYVMGCTNPSAGNYNPDAQRDDGTCTYPGCTDSNACNYNQSAVGDDGSCEYDSCKQACATGTHGTPPNCIAYCADFNACNPGEDGECEYESCASCPQGTNRSVITGQCACDNGAGNPPMCNDYCTDDTATNYGLSLPCTYNGAACCADASAINYDNTCPDSSTHSHSDPASCTYCTAQTVGQPMCDVTYCNRDPNIASNGDPGGVQCQANDPNAHCVENNFTCQYYDLHYCSSSDGLFPPQGNSTTQADCEANKSDSRQQCVGTTAPPYCDYPDSTYCGDNRASNYETDIDCVGRTGGNCTLDNSKCTYTYCTIGFSLDITCPSGFNFKTPDNVSYWYSYQYSPFDPYNESCVGFSYDETNYLKTYFTQKYCGTGQSVACQGGFCGNIDWCPDVPGTQTDPTQCVDVCPNKPGIQTSESECDLPVCPTGSYYNQKTGTCSSCVGGVCNPVNGVCGTATTASYTSDIVGAKACQAGVKGDVTLTNKKFNWYCQGREGGIDASCQADLSCSGGKTYCENKGICSDKCYVGNDCVNSNICVFNGNVSVGTKLDVTPVVNRGDTCVVNIDKTSEVFDAFNETTHCVLSSQDSVISTFDPINLTSDGDGITEYKTMNVQKDMTYTLKCHDGEITATTTYVTSAGACRLNVKTLESS